MYSKRRNVTMAVTFCILVFTLASLIRVNAQSCFVDPPQGPAVIYEDSLLPGWTTMGSWGMSIIEQTGPGGQHGACALGAQFLGNWSGIECHRDNVNTTFLDALVFRVRQDSQNPADLQVTVRKTATNGVGTWVSLFSYLVPNQSTQFTPMQWYSVKVPLTDMGLAVGASISGIIFRASTPTTAYFDDVGLVTALLQFPLAGKTPYTAQVSSILDHSVNVSQENHGYYHQNGIILAYDGEIAASSPVCFNPSCSIMGYKQNNSGTPFNLTLLNYNDDDSSGSPVSPKNVLWYDGHSGYDYPATSGTPIQASTSGTLCVVTSRTSAEGAHPWRNTTRCPYGTDSINGPAGGDSWDGWHMFYIVYPNQYLSTTYSTWYLHSDHLASSVLDNIMQNGYANVNQNDVVAYVGGWSPSPAPPGNHLGSHLHFEVRQNGTKIIDPYGDGSPSNFLVLWKDRP
jgi:hypothetical protein